MLLRSNTDYSVAMCNMADEYPLLHVDQQDDMLVCCFRSDHNWYYFSHTCTPDFLTNYLASHPEVIYAVFAESFQFEHARDVRETVWSIGCNRLFLEETVSIPADEAIDVLKPDDLTAVYKNSKYKQYLSMHYLAARLESGGGFCIRQQGKPIAWIMTHDDGSVGMLHVLENYRGRGYARSLIHAMAKQVQRKGLKVYAHIEHSNVASFRLFESMGFRQKAYIIWCRLRAPVL